MLDGRGGLGLAGEAIDHIGPLGQLGSQELDGQPLADSRVTGFVHRAHAALPEQTLQAVFLREHVTDFRHLPAPDVRRRPSQTLWPLLRSIVWHQSHADARSGLPAGHTRTR